MGAPYIYDISHLKVKYREILFKYKFKHRRTSNTVCYEVQYWITSNPSVKQQNLLKAEMRFMAKTAGYTQLHVQENKSQLEFFNSS